MATAELKVGVSQQQQMSQEVIDLVFKRSGVDKSTVVEAAMKKFFADNLDLLTATERKKYQSVILQ